MSWDDCYDCRKSYGLQCDSCRDRDKALAVIRAELDRRGRFPEKDEARFGWEEYQFRKQIHEWRASCLELLAAKVPHDVAWRVLERHMLFIVDWCASSTMGDRAGSRGQDILAAYWKAKTGG